MGPSDRSGSRGDWTDYPVGVLRQLQAAGNEPPPFRLSLRGNIPLGAGLSSSASVEVATAVALLAHAKATLDPAQIARLCQRAENEFANSPCGIMDQFVITAAVAGYALLIDTRELTTELLPMNGGELKNCRVVIANSGVRHSIAAGGYGDMRHELEEGQAILVARHPHLRDLGDANLEVLADCEGDMERSVYMRCRHVVGENARVREACAAMAAGDAVRLGKAMTASHVSQRDDLRCSVEEIDFLVDAALGLEGCLGARLTGGGFGGCTVNLVDSGHTESFSSALQQAYRQRFGIEAQLYICEAVDGAVARARAWQPSSPQRCWRK